MKARIHKLDSLRKAYKLHGEIDVQGLRVAIENPAGSRRTWRNEKGEEGETVMVYPYGFIRGVKGADGDEIDAYVGPDRDSDVVFVVNQRRLRDKRRFDEHKVMLGFRTVGQAREAYLKHYVPRSLGRQLLGSIRMWSMDRFKAWLAKRGAKTAPLHKASMLQQPAVQHVVRARDYGFVGGPGAGAHARAHPRARVLACFKDRQSAENFVRMLGRADVRAVPESRLDARDRVAFEGLDGVEHWYVIGTRMLQLKVMA